jgi:chemotaxis protein MotA
MIRMWRFYLATRLAALFFHRFQPICRDGNPLMLAIIGLLLVFAAVLGGFLLESGNPYVLMQPAELLIVGGAAAGILLVANPPSLIRRIGRSGRTLLKPPDYTQQTFLRHLRMLYEVFQFAQRAGRSKLETDAEKPQRSPIFSRYPEFLKDTATRDFVCDSLRMLVIGITSPHELDHLMDLDIEVRRRGRREPVSALHSIADALPGLGIVAAVLGVVITMQAIGGSPESVGQKVAAALVGTFLGILLCYGVVGPAASRLEHVNEAQSQFLQVLRIAIVSYARGAAPLLAVEYARRSIPVELRPSFLEMESAFKRDAKIPPVPAPGEPAATEAEEAHAGETSA